jgi:GcrA cell cycle regulator
LSVGDNRQGLWRDEPAAVEVLMRLWFERRLSATDTAAELQKLYPGYSLTRNSVLAKLHREAESRNKAAGKLVCDLSLGGSQPPGRPKPKPLRAPASDAQRAWAGKTRRVESEVRMPDPDVIDGEFDAASAAAVADIPVGQRKSIIELGGGDCRWPCGDPGKPDFFFCGGNAITGLPYCAGHARIAYQRAIPRGRSPASAAYTPRFTATAA